MVAYSFKRRFVDPIYKGLDMPEKISVVKFLHVAPKRQTIRADRPRHARPGEEIQLYHGMRTKQCFLIGRARCIDVQPIYIEVEAPLVRIGAPGAGRSYTYLSELHEFARTDGFADWMEMAMFWYEEHHAEMNDFRGVLIKWEPLPCAP